MLKRLGLAIAVALVLAVGAFASPANAQLQYPPRGNSITCSVRFVERSATITCSARIFRTGSTVTFTLFSSPVVLGTATANNDGVATLTAVIPAATALGDHTITASGIAPDGSPLTLAAPIEVVKKVVNGVAVHEPLARTGSNSTVPLGRAGLVAVVGGALLVLVARKRRSKSAAV